MALTPIPYFADLVSKVESFELFQRSLGSSDSTPTAFTAINRGRTHGSHPASSSNQQGYFYFHKNNSSNRGQTHLSQGCRQPRCNQWYVRPDSTHAHLAKAFNTSCSIAGPDLFMDTEASIHLTTDQSILDESKNHMGKDSVIVENGASLPITHTGTLSPILNIHLLNVLVVSHITKNLLSISKLTSDFSLPVTLTNNLLTIQNCQT